MIGQVVLVFCYICLQGASGASITERPLDTASVLVQDNDYIPVELNTNIPVELSSNNVTPPSNFDSVDDANALYKALKNPVINEMEIIDILARKTNEERLKIAAQYNYQHNKPLKEVLEEKLKGNFKDLILALMTPLPLYYAKQLHSAMEGFGTDENCLVDILCTLSNQEIRQIRAVYKKTFGEPLESHLSQDTSGYFKDLMLALTSAKRDESEALNITEAAGDTEKLLNAGTMKWGTDESKFIKILTERNYNQLRLIFDYYHNVSGHDIEEAIKKEFSGDIKRGLLGIISAARDPPRFFAERLHKSMAGLGVNEKALVRTLVTRNEIDIDDIKMQYESKFGTSLGQSIIEDTFGKFRQCLLALIGEF